MKRYLTLFFVLFFISSNVKAATHALPPKEQKWSFEGVFGKFDLQSVQRGFQVYREVCSACHSLNKLSYRNLEAIGFSMAEIKEIAKSYNVSDINDLGDVILRPAKPSDKFVSPYLNEQAARASNNGAYPVDLSLIIKAREDGANYVYSLLTGYSEAPKDFPLMNGLYYNPYFPNKQIAMPAPLSEGQISYNDGTESSVEQMSRDLVNFLQWAAEPEMERRKSIGLKVMLYLIFFTLIFYIAKKRIWSKLKG